MSSKYLPFLLSFTLLAGDPATEAIRGFGKQQLKAQRDLEARAIAVVKPEAIKSYMEKMAAEPHHAGSEGSRTVAEYALKLFRSWGYEAHIETFEALLPYPMERELEMISPVRYKAKLAEPVVDDDPDSGDAGQLPTFNSYSADGDVTAPVVYVNYGVVEDYEQLAKMGVDVKGKIVLARYGKSWRGTKPKLAAEHGAVACLIYSDPRDDGFWAGDVYPRGPFRPAAGVQRGSVMDMPLYVGDPLTPGWASEAGAKRLPLSEAASIMKIPVMPISYQDAAPLLENLGGAVAPESWRGALGITYHVGPGPSEAHFKVKSEWKSRPVLNVIARMKGAAYPDQWVIYGNHHDAWVNGAQDPISGAAPLLETARALGEMAAGGWKPKRTVVFALWDAEEFGLVGSTEWVEKHLGELQKKAVVYLNSDSNSRGMLSASGSPSLEMFVDQVARDVMDPRMGKSVRAVKSQTEGIKLGPLGAGSDYVAFNHHGLIASLNLGFSGDSGGIYHSIYDSMNWFNKFSDKDAAYGKALAEVKLRSILRLTEAPVLPFEFGRFVKTVQTYLAEVEKQSIGENKKPRVDVTAVNVELAKLLATSKALDAEVERVSSGSATGGKLEKANASLFLAERALRVEAGMPGRPWYKHPITAPGQYTGYGAKTLAGIRESMEANQWDEAARQTQVLADAIRRLNDHLAGTAKLLAGVR